MVQMDLKCLNSELVNVPAGTIQCYTSTYRGILCVISFAEILLISSSLFIESELTKRICYFDFWTLPVGRTNQTDAVENQ